MRRVALNYKDGFTSSVDLESDLSSLRAPLKIKNDALRFLHKSLQFKA